MHCLRQRDAGYSMLDKSKKTLRAFAPPNEEDRYERSEKSQAQVDRESKYHSGILSRNEKKDVFQPDLSSTLSH